MSNDSVAIATALLQMACMTEAGQLGSSGGRCDGQINLSAIWLLPVVDDDRMRDDAHDATMRDGAIVVYLRSPRACAATMRDGDPVMTMTMMRCDATASARVCDAWVMRARVRGAGQ